MARSMGHSTRHEDEQARHDAKFQYVRIIHPHTPPPTPFHHQRPPQRLTRETTIVGEDEFNNRYFEKKTESYGRHRWVEYVDERNPDSLKVTPEWHAWLHHNIDIAPVKVPLPKPMYQTDAVGNSTGTRNAYFQPNHRLAKEFAGTAEEKYEMWKPREKKDVVEKGGDVLDLK